MIEEEQIILFDWKERYTSKGVIKKMSLENRWGFYCGTF